MQRNSSFNKAFTLIELLVVIAIIAILAAILFPVFAQAKVAAKQTADVSNLKNINMGNQLYLNDNDDTWVLWSSGKDCLYTACAIVGTDVNYDDGSAFGLRYMYPNLVNPYIKSGVTAMSSALTDIWASPLSKSYFPQTKYLYAYNYYTLGGFSGCDSPFTHGSCVNGRSTARWGDFADASYNHAATATSIANPAGTLAFADGNILCRPPQYILGTGGNGNDAAYIAIWGPADPGDGTLYNADGAQETAVGLSDPTSPAARDQFTNADLQLLGGKRTVVSYTDSHVKVVATPSLYPVGVHTNRWTGGASDNTGWSRN